MSGSALSSGSTPPPDVADSRSLARRVEHEFASLVRLRGLKFLQQDRVSADPDPDHDAVWLSVIDGSTQEVLVDWSELADTVGDQLVVSCTCGVEEPCKHQWAALLFLDEAGLSAPVPGNGRLGLRRVHAAAELGAASRRPPRPWRRTVDALRAVGESSSRSNGASTAHEQRLDVYYVIDAESMRDDAGEPGSAPLRIALYQRPRRGSDGLVPIAARSDQVAAMVHRGGTVGILADLARRSTTVGAGGTISVDVPHSLLALVAPALCRDGRLGWWSQTEKEAGLNGFRPVTWDEGSPFRLVLAGEDVTAEDGGPESQLCILAELERDHGTDRETLRPSDLEFLFAGGVALQRHRFVRVVDADQVAPWLAQLGADGLRIDQSQIDAALEAIWQLPDLPELRLPERYRWPEEPSDCRPVLTLAEPRGNGLIPGAVRFEYGEFVARPGDARVYWARPDDHRLVARDVAAERAGMEHLLNSGVALDPGGVVSIPAESFARSSASWVEEGWRLEVEGRKVRTAVDFQARVASSIDWFDVEGSMRFGGGESVALPELLRAARERRRLVELKDGSLGLLPAEWLDRFAGLALVAGHSAESSNTAVRFGAHQSLLLDSLLAAGSAAADIRVDETFRRVRDRLSAFDQLRPQPTPEGFEGQLRPYQELGLAWLELLADLRLGGCLADDMGLGKTIQVLAHIWDRVSSGRNQKRPSLLVVPRTLLSNWAAESARFTPQLEIRSYHGAEREPLLEGLRSETLLVTTYGTLLRDVLRLREIEFDVVALDEAQAIKNAGSKRAKASRLLQAHHRLALTGTPVENHLGELWSILEFLNPALLGRLPSLSDHAGKESLPEEAVDAVSRALRPLILRRTKDEVLTDLPQKTEQTLYCDLRRAERLRYEQLRDYYRESLAPGGSQAGAARFEGSKILVLEALLRLRQAACHPGLLDGKRKGQTSSKLEVLVERLQEITAEGHKVLVYSQFTQMLDIVSRRLSSQDMVFEYLDGKTRDRQQRVDRFQTDEDCRIFLISLRAGGLGLNLTAASYVFLLDPWWNPAVEAQAIDRTHRIGQTRPVFAYRLIARDTVEEKILQLQDRKRELADAVVSRDRRFLKNLTAEDLQLLLS
ncbi:MAG: DEAD/DEAH box helicase [Thermoanaerobaculia bacterium]|nr:DEAD/DEAH box helicase [Thermoanaerobaculia bacterium]